MAAPIPPEEKTGSRKAKASPVARRCLRARGVTTRLSRWRRATAWGGFAGLVVGCCLTFGLNRLGDAVFMSDDPYLYVAIWSFLFALIATVVVSLLTPPDPEEKLQGLVYGTVVSTSESPGQQN